MVTLSCFCAELQALQLLLPNSASGIARALPSFLVYIFKFPDCLKATPKADISSQILFNDVEGGSISCGRMGRKWPNLGGLALRHTQRPPTYQDPFFPHPCKKKNQHSIHYSSSCRGKHLIGDIAMVIVKFRPRWPHTWRYALHSLSSPTTTSGHLG